MLPLLEQRGQPLLRAPAGDRCGIAALLGAVPPLRYGLEVELGDPRPEGGDLEDELLGPLGGGRLQGERTQSLAHVLLDVAGALDLRRHPRELELGAMPSALELAEAGRLFDEMTPVFRLRGEHRLDLPLRNDRVHRPTKPDIREELDDVGAPNRRLVDEILPLAATDESPRDRDLAVVELRKGAVLVVEHELDLAMVTGGPGGRAPEQHVVRLLRAQLGRRQRACRPYDRVGDIRLAGPVRADDDGDAGLELELDRVHERLEAAQLDRAKVHAGSLPVATDGPSTILGCRPGVAAVGAGGGRALTGRCACPAEGDSAIAQTRRAGCAQRPERRRRPALPAGRRRGQCPAGPNPIASSACRAASCSAAFFVDPRPMPTCSPAIITEHTKRRS